MAQPSSERYSLPNSPSLGSGSPSLGANTHPEVPPSPLSASESAGSLEPESPLDGRTVGSSQAGSQADGPSSPPAAPFPWRLRTQATVLAVALSAIPTLGVGWSLYTAANRSLAAQAQQLQAQQRQSLSTVMNQFVADRDRDARLLSQSPVLSDPALWSRLSPVAQRTWLNQSQTSLGVYDSLALLDLQGNVLVQSNSAQPLVGNYRDRPYIQQAISTGQVAIRPLNRDPAADLELAAPVRQKGTLVGVLHLRVPAEALVQHLDQLYEGTVPWAIANPAGAVVMTSAQAPETALGNRSADQPVDSVALAEPLEAQLLTASQPLAMRSPQLHLLYLLLGGTIAAALVTGLLTAALLRWVLQPIQATTETLKAWSAGNWQAPTVAKGPAELARLGTQLNQVADRMTATLAEKTDAIAQVHQVSQSVQAAKIAQAQAEHQAQAAEQRAREADAEVEQANQQAHHLAQQVQQARQQAEHLQQWAQQMQTIFVQISETCRADKVGLQNLDQGMVQQAQTVEAALNQLQTLTSVLSTLAQQSQQTESNADPVAQGLTTAIAALSQVVPQVENLHTTVGQTAEQMQGVDATAQQIEQVMVQLTQGIGQMTLMAFNASLITARTPETGSEMAALTAALRQAAQTTAQTIATAIAQIRQLQADLGQLQAEMPTVLDQTVSSAEQMHQIQQNLRQLLQAHTSMTDERRAIATTVAMPLTTVEPLIQSLEAGAISAERNAQQVSQLMASVQRLLSLLQTLETDEAHGSLVQPVASSAA